MKSVANALRTLLPGSKLTSTHASKKQKARRLHFEPLEERALLAANPDVIFSVQAAPGNSFAGSTAWQGGVLGFSGPTDLLPNWVGSSDEFRTEMTYYANTSKMHLEAQSSGKQGTFTAELEAIMDSNWGLYIGSQSIFGLAAWVRGSGYVPYHVELTQSGSVSASWAGYNLGAGSGINASSSISSGINTFYDWDFNRSGGLNLSVGSSDLIGSNSDSGTQIFSRDGFVSGGGIGVFSNTTIYNGEVYQLVWYQQISCTASGQVWGGED